MEEGTKEKRTIKRKTRAIVMELKTVGTSEMAHVDLVIVVDTNTK